MFIDEVKLTIVGGKGGNGHKSFFPARGGPSGGNGGRGGNVVARANRQYFDLSRYSSVSRLMAEDGMPGDTNRRAGANGEDLLLELPIGTTIIDLDTKETYELEDENKTIILCRGGVGGLGNDALKTATRQAPHRAEPGQFGQKRNVKISQKLIADYGLIGMPNAGKSTLLNELTAARAKTANYPFTTLEPNLGVLHKKVIADIPGLIEGASRGKGLGVKFLKHIEKVKLVIHCISSESTNVTGDYEIVMAEMRRYNPALATKDTIILLTKTDLIDKKDVQKKVKELKKISPHVYPVSIRESQSIKALRELLNS